MLKFLGGVNIVKCVFVFLKFQMEVCQNASGVLIKHDFLPTPCRQKGLDETL